MSSHILEIHVFVQFFQAIDELGPDLGSPSRVEVVEVQGELDAGFEGFVECANAVAREDEDAYRSWSVVRDYALIGDARVYRRSTRSHEGRLQNVSGGKGK